MKRIFAPLFALLLLTTSIFGNVNFINISKISRKKKYLPAFYYIKDHKGLYDHWSNKWNYGISEKKLIDNLEKDYSIFSSIKKKNEELYLFLGDIAHYLYNLDDTAYYNIAVKDYNLAIKMEPKDYRAYWFLANHYSQSNLPKAGIEAYFKAQKLLPDKPPAAYWDNYAFATAVANMPSHCIFAMEKERAILGGPGTFELQHGPSILKEFVEPNKDSTYKFQDIWSARTEKNKYTFISRALGIQFTIDTVWKLNLYSLSNRTSGIVIKPTPIKSKKGIKIHYTIAILFKLAKPNDNLKDFTKSLLSRYSNVRKIDFSNKYNKMTAYEIKDDSLYRNIGGAHLFLIGIERNSPKYPGLLLESPADLPGKNSSQIQYFVAPRVNNRFKGRIFYAVMLDSCEDIHQQSLAVFQKFFNDQLIIE